MPNSWMESLMAYRHPFDLRHFKDAADYAGWFEFCSTVGNRANTMEFEAYFRSYAAEALEPWIEVTFWRLYAEPSIRDYVTRKMASRLRQQGVTPGSLWRLSIHFMEHPTKHNLFAFKAMLGFTWGPIGIASAFPAFMRPDWYPMVDVDIAKWVGHTMHAHNAADPSGPQLVRPRILDSGRPVLTTRDFPFMESWFRWCWYTARKLSERTEMEWRSRDVEMAVSNAWGKRGDAHPQLHLNPLPPV
jgi:hypothetical protein